MHTSNTHTHTHTHTATFPQQTQNKFVLYLGKKNEIENWRSTTTSKAATYLNIQNEMENGIVSSRVKQVVLFLYHLENLHLTLTANINVHDLKEILKAPITLGPHSLWRLACLKNSTCRIEYTRHHTTVVRFSSN